MTSFKGLFLFGVGIDAEVKASVTDLVNGLPFCKEEMGLRNSALSITLGTIYRSLPRAGDAVGEAEFQLWVVYELYHCTQEAKSLFFGSSVKPIVEPDVFEMHPSLNNGLPSAAHAWYATSWRSWSVPLCCDMRHVFRHLQVGDDDKTQL